MIKTQNKKNSNAWNKQIRQSYQYKWHVKSRQPLLILKGPIHAAISLQKKTRKKDITAERKAEVTVKQRLEAENAKLDYRIKLLLVRAESKVNQRKIGCILKHSQIALARALYFQYSGYYSNKSNPSTTRLHLNAIRMAPFKNIDQQALKNNNNFSFSEDSKPPAFIKQERCKIKEAKQRSYISNAQHRGFMQNKRGKKWIWRIEKTDFR